MKLNKLLKNIDYQIIKGNLEIEIEDISYDTRTIQKKDAFVALIGIDTDGHHYIKEAIQKGCQCIIVCKDVEVEEDITVIKIEDTRKQLSFLSANLFGNPGKQLIKIAITGTKGKTSTAWMIKQILEQKGQKVGMIGTLGTYINGTKYSHKNTTPESYQIQKFMKLMVDEGVKYLIMETSSQALKVGRIHNIQFEIGIFTNLSMDHVGPREHPSYEDYRDSKALLFRQCQIGILNQDDPEYPNIVKNATCQIYTYGKKGKNLTIKDIVAKNTEDFLGMQWKTEGITNHTFQVSAPGNFSVYNASAAILLCKLLKIEDSVIDASLSHFQVAGRCEIINIHNQFKVVIDFAHNKISMESIIKTMRSYHPNRIIVIFGCGGGRSHDRRYELGEIAGSLADLSIITTDNPRNDNIDEINQDIAKGIESKQGNYKIIKDRQEAILDTLKTSQKNDIILLLGKGHETYQEIKGERYPFHEKEIIQDFINSTSGVSQWNN